MPNCRPALSVFLSLTVTISSSVLTAARRQNQSQPAIEPGAIGQAPATTYATPTPDQLYQLVAPIALFPDNLVAQVLAASTFPDQVSAAYTGCSRIPASRASS